MCKVQVERVLSGAPRAGCWLGVIVSMDPSAGKSFIGLFSNIFDGTHATCVREIRAKPVL